MKLTPSQQDRARGVLLATAAGDALGAPYEFGPPVPQSGIYMHAGGPWELGEWTDDTAMSLSIAAVAGSGQDLRSTEGQSAIVANWVRWSRTAKDVGIQTSRVLALAGRTTGPSASSALSVRARDAAMWLHESTGRTAGNGSLMRTAPVALACLGNPDALTDVARQVSELTHWDTENAEACILWCHAIRHAVITGELLGPMAGLSSLPKPVQDKWQFRIHSTETRAPRDYARNGWVVSALLAAWSAIVHTPQFTPTALADTLACAVSAGGDTDTVAAICGGLIGAAHGASAVPEEWRARLHGWPLATSDTLTLLADAVVEAADGSVPQD